MSNNNKQHDHDIVFLVEDEDTLRYLLKKQMSQLGYEVHDAENGEEAWEKLADGLKPRLLITDIIMPGMSGMDLAEKIRRNHPQLPIIFISGYLHDEKVDFNRFSGKVHFLRKPFTLRTLTEKVEEVLNDSG